MIRHSSSFFVSIAVHIVLFFTLLSVYNNYFKKKEIVCEKKMCIKLCNLQCPNMPKELKEIKKLQIKKEIKKQLKPEQKKPKVKTKTPKPKPKPKPIIKKQPKVKKVLPKSDPNPKPKKKPEVKKETKKKPVMKSQSKPMPKPLVKPKKVEEKPTVAKVKNIIPPQKEIKKEQVVEKTDPAKEYVQNNIAKIAKLLRDNLYYPRRARKKRIVGKVSVKFTLGVDSSVRDIEVINSNHEILSRAAIRTIENLSGEFPAPNEELRLQVPIVYSLK